jgi:6-phosphogluconolactonase
MQRYLTLFLLTLPALLIAKPVHVYFGTGSKEAKGIYRATFNPANGKLTAPTLAAEIGRPGFLAMNAGKTHLYAVATEKEPVVAAYAIGKDGSLTHLNSVAIGDGGGAHIAVHPSGKFLLTAQYGGGSTAVFTINNDGSLKERSQLIEHEGGSKVVGKRQDSPHPHWTGFSPDARFAFVPDLGTDNIHIYKIDGTTLTSHGTAATVPGGGPRHMRFSVDGRFIYLLNELSLSVTTFAYDATVATTKRLTTTPALSDKVKAEEAFNSASEILVHPNGKFVYSANRGNDSVTVYHADTNGKLTVQEVEPVRGSWPRNINLSPDADWLLAAGAHSNTVSVFRINGESGRLTFQTRNVVNVPGAICILFGN